MLRWYLEREILSAITDSRDKSKAEEDDWSGVQTLFGHLGLRMEVSKVLSE